jgi:hypothetical protein
MTLSADVAFVNEHLFYEIDTLARAATIAFGPRVDAHIHNVNIEAMVLHARALAEFLSDTGTGAGADEAYAKHFVPGFASTWSDAMLAQRARATSEIARITFRRKNAGDPDKPWTDALVVEVLTEARRFWDELVAVPELASRTPFPASARAFLAARANVWTPQP